MSTNHITIPIEQLHPFDNNYINSEENITYIGKGAIGGKASGLAFIEKFIKSHFSKISDKHVKIGIPRFVVITTDIFDIFMDENNLYKVALSNMSDEYIAHSFGKGKLPLELTDKLRILVETIKIPLAIRSSSLLEDAIYEPFAGVYATKMIPNNQFDADTRFEKIAEAIKFVYASTFFRAAKDYHKAINRSTSEEKMAVIIQDVIGQGFNNRFYPHISGVARSFNFYPIGAAKAKDGIVNLALGLGKTIVDGGIVWNYSPSLPKVNPPVGSPSELLRLTQTSFWAINIGKPPLSDPVRETEYMLKGTLADAEEDNTLRFVASTYVPQDDKIVVGTGPSGPRVVTFAPILVVDQIYLNKIIVELLEICEKALGNEVEIEFAVTIYTNGELKAQFGFLQVRPMVVSDAIVSVNLEEMEQENVLVSSEKALGNGLSETIEDIVYVDPDNFNAKNTRQIALELAELNRRLINEGRAYLLIGFGRWGSSDPWLGIPVNWSQISGAKTIIEATLPNMDVELSQGTHFFHNMTSFQINFFQVPHSKMHKINWEWLKKQKDNYRTDFIHHIQLSKPLLVKVDGRSGRGVVLYDI
ncbi:MAG: PEP/pyruvate-binding domain-containing protein [bacterium]